MMNNYQKVFLVVTSLIGFLCLNPAFAEITVRPFGFTVSIEENQEVEVELVLNNSGEEEVAFNINYGLGDDENDRRGGPRRDDLGDILHEFDVPNGGADEQKVGVAWDWENNWMWISNNPNNSVVAVDPNDDYNVAREIEVQTPFNVTCLNGHLYIINNTLDCIFHYDTDGENLGNIDVGFNTGAITRSEELGLLFIMNDAGRAIHVFTVQDNGEPDEQIGVIPSMGAMCGDDNRYRAICWVDAHTEGQFWLTNPTADADGGRLWEIFINTEEWEPVEVVANCEIRPNCPTNRQRFGIGHDGENMWTTAYSSGTVRIIDDGIREFHMLTIDPEEGIIPGNDSEAIEITVITDGCEAGVYNMLIEIAFTEPEEERDDFEEGVIQISGIVSLDSPTAEISGTVTDAINNDPIEGVFARLDRYIIGVSPDEEGNYALSDLPVGEYELTFSAPDYLPTIEAVDLGEDDVELNVELLYAEFNPDEDEFFMALEPDMEQTFEFDVSNGGNGPLTYIVERRLANEDANADPWERRNICNAEEAVEDNQLNGVVVVDGMFYVSGGNNRNAVNKIYVLNQEGEHIRDFNQFHESDYGMRDLCWDGELIWGADERTLYGFDTNGELVREIEGEAGSYRSLTYDSENDMFISADITSDIYVTDLEGNLVRTIDRPGDLRSYGLAYWPEDPDDYKLYIFSRDDGDAPMVNKVNLENGNLAFVNELNLGGRPGGIDITNQLDVYSWVFVGIVQTPDRIGVWQLAARRDWFLIEPENGEIAADGSEEFVLTLDATGLPIDNSFEGELVFNHDGIGGQTVIPVRLDVVEGRVPTFRVLDLNIGWNMVSVNLQPEEEDVEVLLAGLVEAGLVIMMKDGAGHFYRPEFNFNNIPGWFVDQGYQIKMRDVGELRLAGISVLRDDPIRLEEGWHLVSYYPNFPIEATLALSNIEDHLIIAKDGFGNFYIPEWEFSNIGNMSAGQGYYLNVDAEVVLRYTFEREEGMPYNEIHRPVSVYSKPGQLPVHSVTGTNMSLLVLADPSITGEIGIYTSGELVGSGVIQNGACGIAVWGDDPSTDERDGVVDGDPFEIKLLDNGVLRSVDYTVLSGEGVYCHDGLLVIQLIGVCETPVEFGISSVYPNPFNSQMQVSYSLPEAGNISLNVYDLTGRLVMLLFNDRHQAGLHTVSLDGSHLVSGIYLIRFEAFGSISQAKVALVK
ncbi:MAG: T9SS type A sorting domain-containing protein [Candidatus Hatepunaea meridiana]|nr:T9SS type A sorting domain-containing protein [Candidatus Hatepunaea meridiana]